MEEKEKGRKMTQEETRREPIRGLLSKANVTGMEDIQTMFKETIAEFEETLGYGKYGHTARTESGTTNSRNGHSQKTLKTSAGKIDINIPRDRNGEFEPRILPKDPTSVSAEIESKIISMYAKRMTTSDIQYHIKDIYGMDISDTTASRITDKVLPEAWEWQQRHLESVYAIVFMDAIHYHVRSESQIVKRVVYIAIGINLEG